MGVSSIFLHFPSGPQVSFYACALLFYNHGGTECTEKIICLSGDTDKQKDSALKTFNLELL
jgi:hypothetical protein